MSASQPFRKGSGDDSNNTIATISQSTIIANQSHVNKSAIIMPTGNGNILPDMPHDTVHHIDGPMSFITNNHARTSSTAATGQLREAIQQDPTQRNQITADSTGAANAQAELPMNQHAQDGQQPADCTGVTNAQAALCTNVTGQDEQNQGPTDHATSVIGQAQGISPQADPHRIRKDSSPNSSRELLSQGTSPTSTNISQ